VLGGNLLFATREEAVDRHLFALVAMSDASHDYTDAKVLQNWLSDVIGHLEALPEPTQIALGLALFKIGDEHFHWRADQIKSWHKEGVVRCGNNCLSYNANNGSSLSARCRRGSARHPWPHRSVDTLRGYVRDAELSSMLSATSSESLGGEEALRRAKGGRGRCCRSVGE
jgi:hypothetical protein